MNNFFHFLLFLAHIFVFNSILENCVHFFDIKRDLLMTFYPSLNFYELWLCLIFHFRSKKPKRRWSLNPIWEFILSILQIIIPMFKLFIWTFSCALDYLSSIFKSIYSVLIALTCFFILIEERVSRHTNFREVSICSFILYCLAHPI